jgi:hypothetical protein
VFNQEVCDMIRYHQITCPHCEGRGIVQRHHRIQQTCPLCGGKGTINDFDRPIEEVPEERIRRVHTCTELLARVVPLGGKSSGILLVNRNWARRPKEKTKSAPQKSGLKTTASAA